MSIPPEFASLPLKGRASLSVLVHLWQFADYDDETSWVFQTDRQLMDACAIESDRHLRRVLSELRTFGLLERERSDAGVPGFRLRRTIRRTHGSGHAEPDAGPREPLGGPREPLGGHVGPDDPLENCKSRRAEEQSPPGVARAISVGAIPAPSPGAPGRPRRRTMGPAGAASGRGVREAGTDGQAGG